MLLVKRIPFRRLQNVNSSNVARTQQANFPEKTLTAEVLTKLLLDIEKYGGNYGFHTNYFENLKKEKIVVEFSSPNIAKLFHIGHYRSTIVGNFVSKMLSAAGHNVYKFNYLGDWGFQFALISVAFKKYGSHKLLEQNPLKHLFDLYVKISAELKVSSEIYDEAQQIFYNMENGNSEALQFWKLCRQLSVEEYKKMYKEIGIKFDVYSGESMYVIGAKTIIEQLKSRGLLFLDGNALKANLTSTSWLSDCDTGHLNPVLARMNGTTLYLSRDVAALLDRFENYNFDRMIYVTDQSQIYHFKQLFALLEQMGFEWAKKDSASCKLFHKTFGRVQKMQTRKGNIVFLNDILDEAYQRSYEDRRDSATRKASLDDNEITKALAKSSLIYYDLKLSLNKGYKFSWEHALASKGNSGMYLQYTHSRLCSIEKYCGVELTTDIQWEKLLSEPLLIPLLHHLEDYTNVIERVYETLEPSYLIQYLNDLSRLTSRAIKTCYVKGQDLNDAQPRLLCFHCAKIVLANGLVLLGILPLEEH